VPTQEKAITQAKAPYEGLSIWSDGSRLDNGRTGAGFAWQDYSGAWKSKEIPLRQEKEVFDAELVGVYKALEIAKQLDYKDNLRILLDSQAALACLQHNQPGPGQMWAIQPQEIAQELIQQGYKVTIGWVPGIKAYQGMKRLTNQLRQLQGRPLGP
jgi:ribonuclease HI